jgi:hypothetical protein
MAFGTAAGRAKTLSCAEENTNAKFSIFPLDQILFINEVNYLMYWSKSLDDDDDDVKM